MAQMRSRCKRSRALELEGSPEAKLRKILQRRATTPGQHGKRFGARKLSEFGRQLKEKQRVKFMYGVDERQFRRFFDLVSRQTGVTGEVLLTTLERRIDNVVYRLKFATSRPQARQMVVHGHIRVNGKKVTSPSYLVQVNDEITLSDRARGKENFVKSVVEKRLKIAIKVPEWLELHPDAYTGVIVREPVRSDIKMPIEEHLIVELYSK